MTRVKFVFVVARQDYGLTVVQEELATGGRSDYCRCRNYDDGMAIIKSIPNELRQT